MRHLRGCKLGEVHEGPCAVPLEGHGFDLVMFPEEADQIVAQADVWGGAFTEEPANPQPKEPPMIPPPPTLPVIPTEPALATTSVVCKEIAKIAGKLAPPRREWRVFAQVQGVRWGGIEPLLDLETPSANGAQHATIACSVSRELARRAAWVWANDRGPLCGTWRVWVEGKWPARAELVKETDRP